MKKFFRRVEYFLIILNQVTPIPISSTSSNSDSGAENEDQRLSHLSWYDLAICKILTKLLWPLLVRTRYLIAS